MPLSQRFTINLAAGVPEYVGDAASGSNAPQSQWWFENTKNSATYSDPTFVESSDSAWRQVGLPYDANIPNSFINQDSGGGQGSEPGNNNWYRLHFKVDPKYAGQKFLLNLEGAHTGVQVFINGKLQTGISAVAADAQATHVLGFVPVVLDLTANLVTDGVTENVIAIDVSRGDTWFETPNFSNTFRFGQNMAGLFRNVFLYVTNPIHIPLNVYSNTQNWGTYVGTVSEVAGAEGVTATAVSAVVEVQTNVVNESSTTQQVTLTTQIVDASGNVVVTAPPVTQSVSPMTPATLPAPSPCPPTPPKPVFDQLITVPNPTLWYPNNSIYGKPYMYKVYHIVSVNGVVVDSFQSPLGIRTITWDANFPYFNGHPMYLWGGASRYDYPALGSSVPDEQWWRDMQQIAAQGGNVWRPGHSPSSEEMVEAADAYGIMIDQPSGDGENHWAASSNPSADDLQLKQEVHRDMIIRDRSHPSILDWEEDNGGMNQSLADELACIETSWDSINPRVQADRTYSPSYAFMGECDGAGCETGVKNTNPNNPSFGAEYWDNMGTGRGTQTGTGANTVYAYDYELAFAAPYLKDWSQGKAANAFGMAQWYFADTPGEDSLWAEFQNQPSINWQHLVRSLGYSSVDQNRFPRMLYYIYQANWIPYQIQPVVRLAHHWNRSYEYTPGTPIQENAFSNCPKVRLLINGVAKDPVTGAVLQDQVPNPWTINSSADLSQSTTVMPGQVHWMVNWAPGTITAECLDTNDNVVPSSQSPSAAHTITTAGSENKIVLSVVPEVVRPDGTSFQWTSNGSDAAFVMAQVQDANGNLVPTAVDNVTFTVTGPAEYMGGTQQLVADPSWTNDYQDDFSKLHSNDIGGLPYGFFHSPGDPELNFEGGLQKIALRSTFTPGTVTVTATAQGLVSGSAQLTSVAPPAPPQSQPPAIIVPPVDTAVTAGQPATFTVAASGSGTLSYQWAVAGSEVTGATSPTLTIPATTIAQNGESVTVTITSNFGQVTSTPVTLTVDAPASVAIITQPASQTAVVGQSATFTVAATGSPQLNYQWFENGGQVQTGPQPSYTTPILKAVGTASIYVTVSNPVNQLQSATATLTINAPTPVSITTPPANQIVGVNQPVQFTTVVAGSAPYTYQWQFTPKGGSAIILASNTTSSNTISLPSFPMSAANVGSYTVTVNNAAAAPVTSAAAQLTLAPPGVNLALDKVATASSSQNACTDQTTTPPFSGAGCLGAENAVDGNQTTRWGSKTAGAPPTPPVVGVDPSWLQVDLGSVQAFNTVIINWENAYAAEYQIQYTNADPATNPTWNVAITNNNGAGGTETLNFNTVQARYIRLFATQRSGNFGYSVYEFQVYNVPQCGGPTERYTINSSNPELTLVMDNLSGLSWTNTIHTDTTPGSQFTGVSAAAYCSSIHMRIPTEAEALGISGNNDASCAFPGVWSTWTSSVDPNDATETAVVNFDGSTTFNVTDNFPGATLCTVATGSVASGPQAPVIETEPQSTTVAVGESATFTVFAAGTPTPSYQWLRNGNVIAGATGATYTTPPTVATDNGASFSVSATNGSGTVTSNAAVLTVTNNATGGGGACTSIPTAPTGLTATATSSSSIGLNWMAVTAPTNCSVGSYNVYGSTTAGFTPSAANLLAAGVTGTSYSNTGLTASTTYYYVVEAVDGDGASTASNQSSAMTGSGAAPTTPNFTINVSSASLPVTAGSSGTETITLAPQNGFTPTAAVNFTCSGLPSDATCSFSPTTITSTGDMVSTLTVNTTMASSTASYKSSPLLPGSVLAVALYFFRRRKRRDLQLLLLAVCVASMTLLTGCGVQPPPPQMATSMITVTASAGSLTHTTTFSLVVETPNLPPTSAKLQNNLSPLLPGSMLAVALCFFSRKRRYRVQLMLVMCVFGMALLSGCSAGTNASPATGGSQSAAPIPPAITVPPASITVTAGQTATFSVTATGTAPLTYQWQSNGSPIAGATAATYTTPALTTKNNGTSFAVVVTNAAGSMTSAPATLTVTAGGSTGCGAAPSIPGSPVAAATSGSQIGLSWSASSAGSSCTVTYNVYRSTTSGFTPASGNLVASGQTGTSFIDNGLTASTTYFYAVVAVDAVGSSAASTQVSATTLSASSPPTPCTTVPGQPTGLAANAASVSSISLSWTADTAPASCSITYNVYASTASGFVPSQTNLVASGITSNLYTNTGLAASTTYFYVIEAVDGAGNSAPSAQVQDTTTAAALSEIIAIHSGGPAVSNTNGGDASFVADEFYDTGGTSASGTAVSVAGVINAAPEAVYQTERNGAFSYTIPGLQPGATYTVLLHFAETYFMAAGGRVFSVAINGTTVLPNLDIFQEAGGQNIALVEPFTATANPQGQIVIKYTRGSADQPKSSGVEVRGVPSSCTLPPAAAPAGLTAQATSPSIINLSWQTVTPPPNCPVTYNLYGSTTSAFTPSASNLIASGLTDLSYSNTGLAASSTYYYVVEAVDTDGASVPSSQVSATTNPANSCISVPTVAPSGFAATGASSSAIGLSWAAITPPANCTNITYNVYGSTTSGFVPSLSNEIAVALANPVFFNTSLPASSTYYYVVQAVDEDGVSSQFSPQVSATTLAPPTQLTATATSPNEIDLTFPASTAPAPVTYTIYRSTTANFKPSGTTQVGTTKSNFYNDAVVTAATTYYYIVQANSPNGTATVGGPVSATSLALGNATPFWDASNLPPTAAGAVLVLKFLNRTNGQYPDDQVFWSATINGVVVTNSIAAQPILQLPSGASGRIPIYLGTPSQSANSYSDFLEYTIGLAGNSTNTYFINMDTTRVDNFGIKNAFQLTCGDGTNIAIGENAGAFAESRASTFQRYLNAVPANFQTLAQVQAPYRIVSPGDGGFDTGGPYVTYYNDWITQLYAVNGLTITPTGIPNGDGLGAYPGISAAIYRHVGGVAGTFNPDGSLANQGLWGNPDQFYQTEPFSYYGKFLHQIAINGQQYTFPYDDNGGYSSDVSCNSPKTLLIAIGW
ncbi:immunoglobulin domain-containing protein [Tunturiibacter lichenicola]|uniref:immunoglobulin domain-containing protein n=1 Tax=Tunturiibacter lichenicola TaxID=2051959 RepID=UPI0021B34DEB|nr:immunoglobulin domain-containing protein [Edaphobacter lichenicola]